MSEAEVVDTKIKLEELSPEEALAAVISGYAHHVSNPLSILAPAFKIGSADQMVMTLGQDMNQRVDISGLNTTEEVVKTTAQAIVREVRRKASQRSYSQQESTEPEKDWFAFTERLVAEKKDPQEKAVLARALARVKVAWTNLTNLANEAKSITLPLEPGDLKITPFQFDFSHPTIG
jgi:hypothetical protein